MQNYDLRTLCCYVTFSHVTTVSNYFLKVRGCVDRPISSLIDRCPGVGVILPVKYIISMSPTSMFTSAIFNSLYENMILERYWPLFFVS